MIIRLGTRGSELALWQTRWVRDRLQSLHPGLGCEIVTLKTTGDKILDAPLAKIGDKGLFTKELDRALLANTIDLAVHSMKDVPTEIPAELAIAAVTERWDVRDVLISRDDRQLDELPGGAKIATGSLRRRAQLLHYRPDWRIVDIRGNLNTRFRKFDASDWDGMILALAGVERLGLQQRISQKLPTEVMLPAVGQGAFAIITRASDRSIRELLRPLHHGPSALAIAAERALLSATEGGCQVPLGALGLVENGRIRLRGCIASLDGRRYVSDEVSGEAADPAAVGRLLADRLLKAGGADILREIRENG